MVTSLIQRYRVEVHPKFAGESFEQLKERYSQASGLVTLTWVAVKPTRLFNWFLT